MIAAKKRLCCWHKLPEMRGDPFQLARTFSRLIKAEGDDSAVEQPLATVDFDPPQRQGATRFVSTRQSASQRPVLRRQAAVFAKTVVRP